jgi:hypothetical protein
LAIANAMAVAQQAGAHMVIGIQAENVGVLFGHRHSWMWGFWSRRRSGGEVRFVVLKMAFARSHLPNHVCDVTICRATFRVVTVLADLILPSSEVSQKSPTNTIKNTRLQTMLAPGWNGVGADITAHTDPGLIGGLATRMQKNQVRRATGAPDFVLESRLALRLRSRPSNSRDTNRGIAVEPFHRQ